ncbi:creatininase family protein [Micromonospora noduli]|uniref:creatininase family protein n=1 Tax=Micromonospora noduli TaxID=709876 RepID=UPI0021AC3327|nr:creatininase family protein [Micromonospora noduli]
MHAGELETSLLLHVAPELVRAGNETADWTADHRPHLLTLGMLPTPPAASSADPRSAPPRRAKLL